MTINRLGSTLAYKPNDERRMEWIFSLLTEVITLQAVKLAMNVLIVMRMAKQRKTPAARKSNEKTLLARWKCTCDKL